MVRLHPIVIEHLRRIDCFDPYVFPWNQHKTTLYEDFHAIQKAAGIRLHCPGHHEHTLACHVYGFHDSRPLPHYHHLVGYFAAGSNALVAQLVAATEIH